MQFRNVCSSRNTMSISIMIQHIFIVCRHIQVLNIMSRPMSTSRLASCSFYSSRAFSTLQGQDQHLNYFNYRCNKIWGANLSVFNLRQWHPREAFITQTPVVVMVICSQLRCIFSLAGIRDSGQRVSYVANGFTLTPVLV